MTIFATEKRVPQPFARMQKPAATACGNGQPSLLHPTHEAIAQRAFDIYVTSCRKQGQCKENWYQAEKQLTNEAGASAPKSEAHCKSQP